MAGGLSQPAPAATGSRIVVGLNAVIVTVTAGAPRVLTVRSASASRAPGGDALPFGPLDPDRDRTLELALRGFVREQAGLELGYVEQLYTFGDRDRHGAADPGDGRVLSIGYLALVRESDAAPGAAWRDVYSFLPWEDRRDEEAPLRATLIERAMAEWVSAATGPDDRSQRRMRVDVAFGFGGSRWDAYRALERYELLYEAGLVGEALRDRGRGPAPGAHPPASGTPMSLDHRRILATALSRVRGKIKYRPVMFELLPESFTLLQLQLVVEALSGLKLHKQNFRRIVGKAGLVRGTGRRVMHGAGRPAELFQFRPEVLRERPTPGVGLPSPVSP